MAVKKLEAENIEDTDPMLLNSFVGKSLLTRMSLESRARLIRGRAVRLKDW